MIAQANGVIPQVIQTGDDGVRGGYGHLRQLVTHRIALQQITVVQQNASRTLCCGLLPGGPDKRGDARQPMMPDRTVTDIIMPNDLHV